MRRGETYEEFDRVSRAEDRARELDSLAKRNGLVWVTSFGSDFETYEYDPGFGESMRQAFRGVGAGWMKHDDVLAILNRCNAGNFQNGVLLCYQDISLLLHDPGGLIPVTVDLNRCRLRDVILSKGKVSQICRFSEVELGSVLWHFPVGKVQVHAISDYHGTSLSHCWVDRDQVIQDLSVLWEIGDIHRVELYTSSGHRCNYELRPTAYYQSTSAIVDLERLGSVQWNESKYGRYTQITGLLSDIGMEGLPSPTYRGLFLWPEWKGKGHVFVP